MRVNGAPTESFKQELRAQLLATAEREGIGDTPRQSGAKARHLTGRPRLLAARPRARGAIVIGVAAGTLALSGVSVASGDAIPGDTLYGMKRSTEKAQLALAGSDLSRGQLYLEFARTRLQEAHAVLANEIDFIGALREMDNETRQGVRILITAASGQHDTTSLDAIDRFVTGQRLLVAQMLNRSGTLGQQQVTQSLELLTFVEQRSKATRVALACGVAPTGNDTLGPVPGKCGTPKTQPGERTSATGPGQPQQAQGPAGGDNAPATLASATPAPSAQPEENKEESGLLDELGRILGGLLGS